MSNELLEKVIRTTEVGAGGGGLLNAEQADRFIDYMWDATVLGSQVRTIRMRATEMDIDKVGVGERLMRVATEAVDDGVNAGAVFTKISLTTKKLRLDWELSTESLEDNLEGEALEDHIARLMATQAGNDIEDVAINGNTALTSDPLMKAFDGWRKLALAGGHVVDHAGQPLNRAAANKALKAMPRKYMQRRNGLKFFTGSNLIQDYLYGLTQTASGLISLENVAEGVTRNGVRTDGPAGFNSTPMFGIPTQEVPLFLETVDGDYSGATGDHGDLWLTFPQNMLWGVKREIQVYREFKPKKDTIEYTMYCRVGTQIENADAFVVVKNIKVSA
ncbi:major capsid protein [Streptomyces phage Comrade]|uniref:Major capsid protein n=3 Tax=Gilsonvirus comrade TaxID=2846395 RepID=A0A345MDW2_9CAUD|nr:virion structural protein [Streptomyces phage Comrade]AXH68743.1 major capsid protein [Streptomyces phage SparkleGoddess]QQO39714.1 major capsid protein [Streptomyces phage Belfort]QZE11624.1 major capsid protein [Streptomyces phage Karp]UTN92284.1 major capsid protein [Streptomyces phage Stigma]AXQ63301.1 major capsid protein [Streptomyces phage Comrade]